LTYNSSDDGRSAAPERRLHARDGPDLGSRVRAVPPFTLTADSST
jgi:hypothetical protein